MELEGDVQGRQDQAQKIIEMPQRDREASTSENQPSSASVVSMYGQERPSVSSLHQQLASASGTQTIQLREELVLAVAQNASAQATVFEAEVKDKLEEAKYCTFETIEVYNTDQKTVATGELASGMFVKVTSWDGSLSLLWQIEIQA